jgi:transposase-like protein
VLSPKLVQIKERWSFSMQACTVDASSRIIPPKPTGLPRTLSEALEYYADPDAATMALAKARWGDAVECLHCHSRLKHFYISTRRIWKCRACRKQFSPRAGTIFEDSPIGLDRWLAAIWIEANSESRISSYRLYRMLGVTQTTARFMLHRIRLAIAAREIQRPVLGNPMDGLAL